MTTRLNLSHVLSGYWFDGALDWKNQLILLGREVVHANLSGSQLGGNFSGVSFLHCNLDNCVLQKSRLLGTVFYKSSLKNFEVLLY